MLHNGMRIWMVPPAHFRPPPSWGRVLVQQWHYAMIHDCPRNSTYTTALASAARRLNCAQGLGGAPCPPECVAVDFGCGSALLSLLLARELAQSRPRRSPPVRLVGAELLSGVCELGRRCARANAHTCASGATLELLRTDARALCTRPRAGHPRASLLLAELMDDGGLGEGLLPLAAEARRSGLLAPSAPIIPARLRVWAMLVELVQCGNPLDGAELVPARACGVSLAPWLRCRNRHAAYAAIEQRAADYAPLTDEVRLFEAILGDDPPSGCTLDLSVKGSGYANAVLWSWEVDLDDSGSAELSNAVSAPRSHWRQAVRLLPRPMRVVEGERLAVSVDTRGGTELSFQIVEGGGEGGSFATGANSAVSLQTSEQTREHIRRCDLSLKSLKVGESRCSRVVCAAGAAGAAGTACTGTMTIGCTGSGTLARTRSGLSQQRRVSASAHSYQSSAASNRRRHRSSWARACFRHPRSNAIHAMWPPASSESPSPDWLEALERSLKIPLQLPGRRGVEEHIRLCEAALDIAAQPAMFGVVAADAHQAVRALYAT